MPTTVVVASTDDKVRDRVQKLFHSATLRVYTSDDVVGVEVGGALKNVFAIGTASPFLPPSPSLASHSPSFLLPPVGVSSHSQSTSPPPLLLLPSSPGAGIVEGLGFGLNSTAGFVTRGSAELTRLAIAMGAHAHTIAGMSGMGDLMLTCFGSLSRNRTVGVRLGKVLPPAFSAPFLIPLRAKRSSKSAPP